MGLIDTHTHLESFARNGTLAAVLERARETGVERLITIGTSPDDWDLYRSIARDHRGFVDYSVGVHPCSVEADWSTAVAGIDAYFNERVAHGPLPVALGECGLDRFHLPKDPARSAEIFGWQQQAFASQLTIAKRLGCPVIVHSRGAFPECVAMIDESGVDWQRVVFHCFTDGVAEMDELMRRGGYGSFTGILTYKSAHSVRDAATAQGIDRCMFETDAPYLTPMPHRGKPNEPAFVRHTAEFAASSVFNVEFAALVERTAATSRQFFRL